MRVLLVSPQTLGEFSTLSYPHVLNRQNHGASSQGWVRIREVIHIVPLAQSLALSNSWLYLFSLPCQPPPGFP